MNGSPIKYTLNRPLRWVKTQNSAGHGEPGRRLLGDVEKGLKVLKGNVCFRERVKSEV